MLTRWAGWPAAIAVTLLTLALVLGELTDAGLRRWWAARTLTTDTVSGLLVLLITLLVVDQLLRRQRERDQGRAVAAQAAIMVAQATRAGRAMAALRGNTGAADTGPADTGPTDAGPADAGPADAGREAAVDEVRTYMMMLLVGAPVLIENRVSRHFLEEAQYLGAIMAATLSGRGTATLSGRGTSTPAGRGSSTREGKGTGDREPAAMLDDAVERLRAASAPLLRILKPDERAAANTEELLG
jgi:hypothetical protein